jgi:hypothetical protein
MRMVRRSGIRVVHTVIWFARGNPINPLRLEEAIVVDGDPARNEPKKKSYRSPTPAEANRLRSVGGPKEPSWSAPPKTTCVT